MLGLNWWSSNPQPSMMPCVLQNVLVVPFQTPVTSKIVTSPLSLLPSKCQATLVCRWIWVLRKLTNHRWFATIARSQDITAMSVQWESLNNSKVHTHSHQKTDWCGRVAGLVMFRWLFSESWCVSLATCVADGVRFSRYLWWYVVSG